VLALVASLAKLLRHVLRTPDRHANLATATKHTIFFSALSDPINIASSRAFLHRMGPREVGFLYST